ncbi:fibronectin type III domain-containing protein [Butyrivibrio sp. VCD2006]|uniref:fibronectin type III domain-containing protein n=1 Tax=Butyrivibrio sp. VCD2006 TaxID=1280664 RepID=UPI00041F1B00|nr:fibronectin type III domain-containing protein [Butyrivibrio sp. VCD2006]
MKHFFKRIILCAAAAVSVFAMSGPLNAKAEYNNRMHVIDATDTTLTIDWSMAAEDLIAHKKAEGYKNCKFTKFVLKYAKVPCDINKVRNGAGTSIKTSARQYTIKKLKPGTDYFISISYEMTSTKGGETATTYHNFQLDDAMTTKSRTKTAELLGTTGSTATLDLKPAFDKLIEEYKADEHSYTVGHLYIGYADEQDGTEEALKKAKEMSGKKFYYVPQGQTKYMLRGLTPGHSYTFVAGVPLFGYNDEIKRSDYRFEYVVLSGIKPTGEDDSNVYNYVAPGTSYDTREDQAAGNRYLDDIEGFNPSLKFETVSGKNSITIDWSKQEIKSMKINPVGKEKKIYLSCVEEAHYDRYEDNKINGPQYNYGPNVREAAVRADAKQYEVDPKSKSFTFTNLKPATSYVVMMRCSYKSTNTTCSKIYPFKTHVLTEGGKTADEVESELKTKITKASMYDGAVRREGAKAHVDWTSAISGYYGQSELSKHFARLMDKRCTWVGYAKLPKNYSQNDVRNSYRAAERMASYHRSEGFPISYPYTNTIVYGLDPAEKYVFAVSFNTTWFNYGTEKYLEDTIYIDETGTNFIKAEATNSLYDGHAIDWRPGDGGGSGNGGEGESGGSGSGNGSDGGSGGSGSGNSSEDGSGGSDQGSGNGPRVDSDTPAGSAAGFENTANGQWKSAGTKKNDQAWILYNTGKVSYKMLKKKAQTVSIKVENSEGKITVKDVTSRKNRNVAKVKIKGRKISVKFNKGTPKGTYKFKVTVASKGKIKKTTETVVIKVK